MTTQWSATDVPMARAFRYSPAPLTELRRRYPYQRELVEPRLRLLRYA